jgi:hypothetical protein
VIIGVFVYGVAYFSSDYGWLCPDLPGARLFALLVAVCCAAARHFPNHRRAC